VTRALQRASATLYALVIALSRNDRATARARAGEVAVLVLQDAAPRNHRRRARPLLDQMRRTYPLHAPRARCARPNSPLTTARATM
jgi:hypothetical protein